MNAVVVPSPLVTGSDFTTSCISPTITTGVQQLFDTNAYCKTKSTIPRMPSRARSVTGAIAEPTTTNAPQPLTQRQPAQDPRPIRVSGGNKVRSGTIRLPQNRPYEVTIALKYFWNYRPLVPVRNSELSRSNERPNTFVDRSRWLAA